MDSNALLYSNGEVVWVPHATLRSICPLNITTHPYDEQICNLKFGSWTYDGYTYDLQFYNAVHK